jgi:hypothetical protein
MGSVCDRRRLEDLFSVCESKPRTLSFSESSSEESVSDVEFDEAAFALSTFFSTRESGELGTG